MFESFIEGCYSIIVVGMPRESQDSSCEGMVYLTPVGLVSQYPFRGGSQFDDHYGRQVEFLAETSIPSSSCPAYVTDDQHQFSEEGNGDFNRKPKVYLTSETETLRPRKLGTASGLTPTKPIYSARPNSKP